MEIPKINENNSLSEVQNMTDMQEVLSNTREIKRYLKWQLIITVSLVVLPILAMVIVLPMLTKSLGAIYGEGGVMQNMQGLQDIK